MKSYCYLYALFLRIRISGLEAVISGNKICGVSFLIRGIQGIQYKLITLLFDCCIAHTIHSHFLIGVVQG